MLNGAKAVLGVVGVPPLATTFLQVNYVDPLSGTTTLQTWASTSDADIVLSAGLLFIAITAEVELSPSSPILQ
jgi:hypothetical protein